MKDQKISLAFFLFICVFLLFMSSLFLSCQKEESEFINDSQEETLTADSILAKLLLNTSQNSGSIDDFIDGTSCSSIQFPYQVIVNGQAITLENEEDVTALSNNGADITIIFPVTVVFEDFSTAVVNDQQELNALGEVCDSIDEAISCIDLVYPVTFFTYNAANEQTGTAVIDDDAALFAFLSSLDEDSYIALDFPITVVLADGNSVTVTSNAQLQGLIESCEDIITDPSPLELETVLTTDSWFISFFFDDEDQTSDYADYEFVFNTNGTTTITNGSNVEDGTWSIDQSGSSHILRLILEFDDEEPLEELEEDWKVIDFSNDLIRLKKGNDFLTFSRTPFTSGGTNAEQLRDILTDGNWFVALFMEDGEDDETSNFDTFQFNFIPNGQVVVTNPGSTLFGTWFVEEDDDELELILNFEDAYPLDELDDDWLVFELQNNQVELRDDDDGDADLLIFEKL